MPVPFLLPFFYLKSLIGPRIAMTFLNLRVGTIDDPEAITLMKELSAVTGVDSGSFINGMFLHFLQQCLFSNGSSQKPVKISKDDLDEYDPHDQFLLREKIGKLGDPLFQTFEQLANETLHNRYGIEHYSGTAVYVFLNKMMVPVKLRPRVRFFK